MNTQEILKPIQADFENFLFINYEGINFNKDISDVYPSIGKIVVGQERLTFYQLPLDLQLGVFLRYFRERRGIYIYYQWNENGYYFQGETLNKSLNIFMVCFDSLNSDFNAAFSEALTKAVELVKGEVK